MARNQAPVGGFADQLRAAAPGLPVIERTDPWHGVHGRADLPDADSVQFVYLFRRHDGISLALYPADTLGQARVFYKDDARVRNTLELGKGDWTVLPNFHFGFMEKGLTWTTSLLDVRDYTDYWRGRIHTLGNFSRDEWERELQRLVQARVFDERDLDQFDRDFIDTNRQEASPRPGLRVTRSWTFEEGATGNFPVAVESALVTALASLGEHRSVAALRLAMRL